MVLDWRLGLYCKMPLSPMHVATKPPLILSNLFSFIDNHVIAPIVSGMNKNLYE